MKRRVLRDAKAGQGTHLYPGKALAAPWPVRRRWCRGPLIENGTDPIHERRKARAELTAAKAKLLTFDEAAKAVVAVKRQEFRNAKHTAQWETTLATYVSPVIGA